MVRARKARFGLPTPFLAVRRLSMVELTGGPGAVGLAVAGRTAHRSARRRSSGWCSHRSGTARATLEVVGHLPDGATWPINERALLPWVRRRRIRRVAAFGLLVAGLLNVVFALLWPVRWVRPVGHWLPFGIHPVSGVTAVIGGLALAGVARGRTAGATAGPGWRLWCSCW